VRTQSKTHKNSKSKTTNKNKKMKKRPEENAMKRMSILIFAAVFAWFGLYGAPNGFGVVPVPDGGYPNFNTAEGQNALLSLDTSTGFANTAVGSLSLDTIVDASFNTGVGAGALSLNTGNENTAVGAAALLLNTTGEANTAVGVDALLNNTIGEGNTATGDSALLSNTTGGSNTANGNQALVSNTTGSSNTAIGDSALNRNTTGTANTAIGTFALFLNDTGIAQTANGFEALFSNIDGRDNTANGAFALANNTDGSFNTATGSNALLDNTVGSSNTANGYEALFANTEGVGNTAVGEGALHANTSGSLNTAIGVDVLSGSTEGNNNIAVGSHTLFGVTTGNNNTALGQEAGANLRTSDSNNIDVGYNVVGVAGESDTIRIGNNDITDTFITGISGTTIASGATVLVASNGHLGTVTSSQRFKEDVTPMDKASEALFSLKPVTFRYRKEIDPVGTLQFGLVAEEVEKINPDLVVRDEKGQVNGVRYDQVNAMLLNEFLKEHRKVRELEATLAREQNDFQSKLSEQEKQIAALASGLHKVRTELEISRSTPQMASLPAVAFREGGNNP